MLIMFGKWKKGHTTVGEKHYKHSSSIQQCELTNYATKIKNTLQFYSFMFTYFNVK